MFFDLFAFTLLGRIGTWSNVFTAGNEVLPILVDFKLIASL